LYNRRHYDTALCRRRFDTNVIFVLEINKLKTDTLMEVINQIRFK
jgi:hypothetical protein